MKRYISPGLRLLEPSSVRLVIYGVTGEVVWALVDRDMAAREHPVSTSRLSRKVENL